MYAPPHHHLATAAAQQQQQQQQQAVYYAALAQQQQQHAYAAMMAFPGATAGRQQQQQPFYSPMPSPQGPVYFVAAQPQHQQLQAPPPMQLSQQAPQPTAYFVNGAGATSNGAYVLVPASDFASLYQQQQQYGSPFVVQSQQTLTQRGAEPEASSQRPASTTPPGAAAVHLAPPAATASLPVPLSASRLLHVGDTASSPSLGVSGAAPTVASSSSQSAYEDHLGGVDSVTLRSLERLMDEEEIAAAMLQLPTSVATTPARSALPSPAAALAPTISPPTAPAAAEGKVTPPAEAVTSTAACTDANAVKSAVRGKKPSTINSTATLVDDASSKPAQQAKPSAAPKTTFKALSSGSSSALALPSLKFSSSRQKKGNRPTQVPPPAPGDSEKGPRQLIVNYLAPEVDSAGLEHLFAPYGDIEVARIVTDTATGLSRGYGFIYYRRHIDAETAIDEASGRVLLGRRIRVSYAVPQRAVSSMLNDSGK